ncbi:glycoside hydrolase family 88 protein [Lachnospiraceae bacterium 54-53]
MNNTVYKEALSYSIQKVRENLDIFTDRYPHVSEANVYKPEENGLWTSSFYPGMCFLAYEATGDRKFLKHEKDYLDSFEDRLNKRKGISHDLGFLYTLTCVADYKLTGSRRAYDLAQKAASLLTERYHERGRYIQAWGEIGIAYPHVKIIIDTMLNLPLLYWSGKKEYFEMARNHAETSARFLIRPDFTSYHTYLMDPETGEGVCGKTHQGYADESTWARGQAWAVYGYALTYRYTKEERFLQVAEKAAEMFQKNLPKDRVPYWDFTFTDENPDIRDTSAGAIFCCGLLELGRHVGEEEAARYRDISDQVMESLCKSYTTRELKGSNGTLAEGMYHRRDGAGECVSWGDYFFLEALVRMTKEWDPYW